MSRCLRRIPNRMGAAAMIACLIAGVITPGAWAQRAGGHSHPSSARMDAGADVRGAEPDAGVPSDASELDASETAEPSDLEQRRQRAGTEFGAGMEDYRRGDFARAAQHFASAFDALPDGAPLFNMARAWEGANEIGRALEAYQRYLAYVPNASDADEVRSRISLLRARPTELFLTTQPPGAFVFVDGSAEPQPGTTPLVVQLAPGQHGIALVRDGHVRAERVIEVRAGNRETLAISLRADDPNTTPGGGSRVDSVILDRRVALPFATRVSFLAAIARPYESSPFAFALGGDFTLFYRRNFEASARLLRVETDGVWTMGSVGAGYVFPIEDIDLALVGHLGAAYGFASAQSERMGLGRIWNATVGAELRADWYFHRRLSVGAFFRMDVRTDFASLPSMLPSLGLALSLTP
ncbi:MAG: PEGA domain-containing protein [Deltaproteobacteria bacterium]|nr:PEGA domain-containing protein [Deltaproteobacteria bacterium]